MISLFGDRLFIGVCHSLIEDISYFICIFFFAREIIQFFFRFYFKLHGTSVNGCFSNQKQIIGFWVVRGSHIHNTHWDVGYLVNYLHDLGMNS